MKKTIVSALILIIAVAITVAVYGKPSSDVPDIPPGPPIPDHGGSSVISSELNDPSEDSDSAPQGPVIPDALEKDGMLYLPGLEIGDAPEGYFNDALIIGDSRAAGMKNYGNIKDGAWFCVASQTIYTCRTNKINVKGYGDIKLDALLKKKSWGKIYICMGINELGYGMEQTKGKYKALVDELLEKTPAKIIFISNLHMIKSKSDKGKYINNKRIDELNAYFKSLQDGSRVFYLESNVLFDNENGDLDPQYTNDGTHPFARYYAQWTDYIKAHAVLEAGSKDGEN